MSKYSETIGSFLRTGNFPLEADYIFNSETELVEFYKNSPNKEILHEGLLKIVKLTDKQSLYWVVKEGEEFVFKKLIDDISLETLLQTVEDLKTEVLNREDSDNSLQGLIDNLELLLLLLEEKVDDNKSIIKAIAGTELDDVVEYLKTLDYLNLTAISTLLHKFFDTIDDENTEINTLPELKEFLRGFEYTHNLYECFVDFWNEIEGDPTPNTLFRTLRGVQDFVEALASVTKNRDDNLLKEIDQTQIGIGLSGDGSYSADKETHYLQDATSVMNALKTLDGLIYSALQEFVISPSNRDVVPLEITKTPTGYTIGASLSLSNNQGNQLVKKSDGLYINAKLDYDEGLITFKVNDSVISQFNINISSILKDGYYNSDNEEIVLEFNTQDGSGQTVRIPVSTLIREWQPDNTQTNKVVEITREEVINGVDKLSADVRISEKAHNRLLKDGNSLYVGGTSDDITYNDQTLTTTILEIQNKNNLLDTSLTTEIAERKQEDLNLKTLITNNNTSLTTEVNTIKSDLADEILDRKDADQAIKDDVAQKNTTLTNSIADLTLKVTDNTTAITNLDQEVNNNLVEAKSYTDTLVAAERTRATLIETGLLDKLDSVTLVKQDVAESGFAETYYLSIDNRQVGAKINVREDKVVESVTVKEVTSLNTPYPGALVGDKYIEFVFKGDAPNLYLPVSDLVIKYVEGNGISITNNTISAKVFINDKYLENSTDGIKSKGIDTAIEEAKNSMQDMVDSKAPIDSPVLTGVPQVAVSPDPNDSSQRIPSTNWVLARIAESSGVISPNSYWLILTE